MSWLSEGSFYSRLRRLLRAEVSGQALVFLLAVPFITYAIGFGATFWIDGRSYSSLAASFGDPKLFHDFNSGWGRLSLGHLQPGIPLLCVALDVLPDEFQWPILVTLQRCLALFALLWCCLEACNYRPKVLDCLICSLLAWLPFYQSFHNALLTESLASSLMLMAVAVSLSIVAKRKLTTVKIFAGCFAIVAITNVRSYLGLSALFILLLGATCTKNSKSVFLSLTFMTTAAFGGLIYPSIRWVNGADWFLPENNLAYFMAAGWSSECGGSNFAEVVHALPVDARPPFLKAGRANSEFTYDDAYRLIGMLSSHGYTTENISDLFADSARALNKDNHNITEVRIRKAFISQGMPNLALFGLKNTVMHRGMAFREFKSHIAYVYQYQSWSEGGRDFDRFFKTLNPLTVGGTLGGAWFVRTHERYVSRHIPSLVLRLLAYVPLDVWATIGTVSISAILLSGKITQGLTLFIPCLMNFIVMYSVPLGNTRYSYVLVPLYFIATICALRLPLTGTTSR